MQTTLETSLSVWLKGADLFASTAELALTGKMGYADRLIGLRRLDLYRLSIAAPLEPSEMIDRLIRVLDRQSTFYNRNKHAYTLTCTWDGHERVVGATLAAIRDRWAANCMENLTLRDLDGKESAKQVILDGFRGFLVEVLVEDEDSSGRAKLGAKLESDLNRGGVEDGGFTVTCNNQGTVWWLGLRADDEESARQLAKEITVSTRRDSGLLLNPNYQHAEFVSVSSIRPGKP